MHIIWISLLWFTVVKQKQKDQTDIFIIRAIGLKGFILENVLFILQLNNVKSVMDILSTILTQQRWIWDVLIIYLPFFIFQFDCNINSIKRMSLNINLIAKKSGFYVSLFEYQNKTS